MFRSHEFTISEFELYAGGNRVALEPKPLRVLYYLASSRGRVVTKAELLEHAWGKDISVSESALSGAIKKVRAALGDDPKNPRFIKTVPRIGFQWIAPAEHVSTSTELTVQTRPEAVPPEDRSEFVRDVSVPDGYHVFVNEVFYKAWEIRNVGRTPWVPRFLKRSGPHEAPGRLRSEPMVPIPPTHPGESCVITVRLQAPPTPGTCHAEWKMTDASGRLLLPHQLPVYISIDVRERPRTSRGKA